MVKARKFTSWNVNDNIINNRKFIVHFLKSDFNNIDILRNYTNLEIRYFPLEEVRKLCLEDNIEYAVCEIFFDEYWRAGNVFIKNSKFTKKYENFGPFYFEINNLNIQYMMSIFAISRECINKYKIDKSNFIIKKLGINDSDIINHFRKWKSIWKYVKDYPCIETFRIMENFEM